MKLIETIIHKMSNISRPQRKFLIILFSTIQLLRGKMNFRNLSRYSDFNEKTYSRQFRKSFDFAEFNRLSIESVVPKEATQIATMDCTFVEKSGKHTYGLDLFYNSSHRKPQKGLEFSDLAIVDVDYNTAYNISIRQTPATDKKDKEETRIDFYVDHLKQDRNCLPENIHHLAVDGYYAKKKFIDGSLQTGLHIVGKLRHDANLRYLYNGKQKPHGRHRQYDGKVDFLNVSRFELAQENGNQKIYTAVVNSVTLKRNIRIAYICEQHSQKLLTALLFSTDTGLSASEIYRYYTARFQIEFLFRDAKQFTGLSDCQARYKESLHFHANASMTALNLIKIEDRILNTTSEGHVISINSWKIKKFNEHQIDRIFSMLDLDLSLIKSHPQYEDLVNYGAIAA